MSGKPLRKVNGVFEGGGVRGLAYAGAIAELSRAFEFVNVGGSSAGAIVAAFLAAGWAPDELKLLLQQDFSKLLDPQWPFPWVGLLRRYSLYKGDRLHEWVRRCLAEKGVHRFADLPEGRDLRIVAADILTRSRVVYSRATHPDTSVAEAVRISAGIPFFFEPLRLQVDGGLLNNFPSDLFEDSRLPTIGLRLVSDAAARAPVPPRGIVGYVRALVGTMLDAHDKIVAASVPRLSVIRISTGAIGSTDFDLDDAQKQALFEQGQRAAAQWRLGPGRRYDLSPEDERELQYLVSTIDAVYDRLAVLEAQGWLRALNGGGLSAPERAQLEAADAQLTDADSLRVPIEPRKLARAFVRLAINWRQDGADMIAVERLKRAAQLDPAYVDAWQVLGETYTYMAWELDAEDDRERRERLLRRANEALARAEELTEGAPTPEVLHTRGWYLDEMGDYGSAVRRYLAAIALAEKSPSVNVQFLCFIRYNCACACAKMGQLQNALHALRQMAERMDVQAARLLAEAEEDPDLVALKQDERARVQLAELVAVARRQVEAAEREASA